MMTETNNNNNNNTIIIIEGPKVCYVLMNSHLNILNNRFYCTITISINSDRVNLNYRLLFINRNKVNSKKIKK